MRGRLGLFLGFGAGYVLGAKAGTERYEQLRRLYDNVKASPAVQRATGRVAGAAATGFEQAKGAASEGVHKVTDAVKDRKSNDHSANLSVAPPPAH